MATVRIEGVSEALRMFDGAPAQMVKAAAKAMRAAGAELARDIRRNVPREFRRLVKSKVVTVRASGNLNAGVGLFKGKTPGTEIPAWFKAYWKNYGTLSRRDPAHRFDRPVKGDGHAAARRRRNRVGQPHENFYEDALRPGYEARFVDTFVRSLKEQGYDIDKE